MGSEGWNRTRSNPARTTDFRLYVIDQSGKGTLVGAEAKAPPSYAESPVHTYAHKQ